MERRPPYDQLVLSGGGLRCFWQGGFMDAVRDDIGLAPACIAPVSGGMVDQALIALTRRYRNIPDSPDRDCLAPSEEAPVDKIDFTEPEMLRRTRTMGAADGRRWLTTTP